MAVVRRVGRIVGVLVILFAAIVLIAPLLTNGTDPTGPDDPDSAAPETRASSRSAVELVAPADARPARATSIADGDSFEIVWSDTNEPDEVRLLGINAPEREACFGSAARDILVELIDGQDLLVQVVETEDDGFGRRIANVWVGDTLVNLAMVADGGALMLTDAGRFADLIADAQRYAQAVPAGVWGPDGCQRSGSVVVIEDLRADAQGRDDLNPNDEWIDIRNTGSEPIDLTDWGIRDESTRHRFWFPGGFVLDANSRVRVHSGCDSDERGHLYWCASDPVWNNRGDTGYLVDADGNFVDSWPYSG